MKIDDFRRKKDSKPLDLNFKFESKSELFSNNIIDISSNSKRDNHQLKSSKNINFVQPKNISNKAPFSLILKKIFPEKNFGLFQIFIFGLFLLIMFVGLSIYSNSNFLRKELIGSVYGAYNSLIKGKEQLLDKNFIAAEQDFSNALSYFNQAETKLKLIKQNLNQSNYPDLTQSLISSVFEAGNKVAESGVIFSRTTNDLKRIFSRAFSQEQAQSLTDDLKSVFLNLENGIINLSDAEKNLANIPSAIIPSEYAQTFSDVQQKINKSIDLFYFYKNYFPQILTLLGDEHPQRYLILFQNKNERRPTGGFIGSFAILDINDGYVTKFDIHDIYDFDGQFHEDVTPPDEIKKLTDNWRMRDSNYSPDFAISAAKAEWFLQKEGGPSADHVIAIDQSLLTEIIKKIGPVTLPDFSKPVLPEDLDFMLSYVVESKLRGETNPKDILKDLKLILVDNFKNPEFLASLLPVIQNSISDKTIQAWSKNEEVQKFFTGFGLNSQIRYSFSNEDYLNVVDISVGGNKSDRFIDRKIEHSSFVSADGAITNKVSLTKKHLFTNEIENYWNSKLEYYGFSNLEGDVAAIMGDSPNYNMQRIYVPAGSKLESVSGIESSEVQTKYDSELDKTYFYFPMKLNPGEEKSISLIYTLPFKFEDSLNDYIFYYQNQAGTKNTFVKKLSTASSINTLASYPEDKFIYKDSESEFINLVDQDFHLSLVLEKNDY